MKKLFSAMIWAFLVLVVFLAVVNVTTYVLNLTLPESAIGTIFVLSIIGYLFGVLGLMASGDESINLF